MYFSEMYLCWICVIILSYFQQ